MKISVDHDLVPLGFQILKPANKPAIFSGRAAPMIIRHDQERADRDAAMSQLRDYFLDARLRRGRDIVNRNDQRRPLRFRREREEGRQRRRTGSGHAGIFGLKWDANKPNP